MIFESKEELNMVKETLDLYLNCNKIGEEDIYRIQNYKNDILKKLGEIKWYIDSFAEIVMQECLLMNRLAYHMDGN